MESAFYSKPSRSIYFASSVLEVSTFSMLLYEPGYDGEVRTGLGHIGSLIPGGIEYTLCHGPFCGQRHLYRDWEVGGASCCTECVEADPGGREVHALRLLGLSIYFHMDWLQVKGAPSLEQPPQRPSKVKRKRAPTNTTTSLQSWIFLS